MPARPSAVAPPKARGNDSLPPAAKESAVKKPTVKEEESEEDFQEFSDLGFSKSSLDFQVDTDFDPVDAPAEEAAMLFANAQDLAAQAILEDALKLQKTAPAERLWLMLFDLYRLLGKQSAFEAMGIEYARAFEKSPPGWGLESGAADAGASNGKGGNARFKGDLLGGNDAAFDAMRLALDKSHALRLDMSRVKAVDAEGCARFMELLLYARKHKWEVDLLGRDALLLLVKASVEAGKAEQPVSGKECWFLLFELLQQQGQQDIFEDLAIDYAVTFEESPPSWDAGRVAAPAPATQETAEPEMAENTGADDNAYVLSGDIRSARFADLPDFAQKRDALLIDCGSLLRIDFISVGVLLNLLMTVRNSGKQIVFRHPNRLVAELFRVVGLTGVASLVFVKH